MAPALFLFGEENRFTLVKGQDKKKKTQPQIINQKEIFLAQQCDFKHNISTDFCLMKCSKCTCETAENSTSVLTFLKISTMNDISEDYRT